MTWVPQRFSHRCTCINQDLDNPLSPNYLAFVDVHLEMGGPVYTPSSQYFFKTRKPLRDFQWPAADYPPQQVLLNNPAPRNVAGKGKSFRVIEVLREINVVEYGHIQLGVVATNSLPIVGYNGFNNTDVWIFGHQEITDVSAFPESFPREANHPSIADRYNADIVCPSHPTHDPDCGICHFAQLTQVTPLSLSNAEGAVSISNLIADSGKILFLTSRPTTSPAGRPADDFGKSPADPLAWATWSVKVKAHFVTAEGVHINRPLAPPLWEAWNSASATQATPETEKPLVDNPRTQATPLTTVKAQAQRVVAADGPPPKGPVGRWMDDLPAKQPPPVKPAPKTGSYPHNQPTAGQFNVAQQFTPPQRITTSADEPLHVVAPPPDETFIWHCKRHALPTIGDPCLHCSKWIMSTTRQCVAAIHRAEPRSVVME